MSCAPASPCSLTLKPRQGDSLAIYDCMMVKGGSYKSASSAFWLAFWSVQAVREPPPCEDLPSCRL